MTFDPRTLGIPVYEALIKLRSQGEPAQHKEQKSQAVELYTYLSTWGLLRLKAEEDALKKSQPAKQKVVECFFQCLQDISGTPHLVGSAGIKVLKELGTEEYLGLTGLGLAISREFSFWTTSVYADVQEER
jgi:hypothetical protein